MPRIDAEKKAQALQMIADVGVQKTHDEMGISTNTLYKWQREAKAAPSEKATATEQQQIQELLAEQERLSEQLEKAQKEVAELSRKLAEAKAELTNETTLNRQRIKRMKKIVDAAIESM